MISKVLVTKINKKSFGIPRMSIFHDNINISKNGIFFNELHQQFAYGFECSVPWTIAYVLFLN